MPEPLAQWLAAAHELGNAARMSPFEEQGRNTFRPGDFEVKARFTVGKETGNFASLLTDRWNSAPQSVMDPSGNPYPANTHIEGYVVSFKAGSKEKDGQTAVGNAQVQLLLRNAQGESMLVFCSRCRRRRTCGRPGRRWRYDGRTRLRDSGRRRSAFAFEFPCPPGDQPAGVVRAGVRVRWTAVRAGAARSVRPRPSVTRG